MATSLLLKKAAIRFVHLSASCLLQETSFEPLGAAVAEGDVETLSLLLAQGADPNLWETPVCEKCGLHLQSSMHLGLTALTASADAVEIDHLHRNLIVTVFHAKHLLSARRSS